MSIKFKIMNKIKIIGLFSLLFVISCSPKLSSSFTKEDYTDNKYQKVVVIGISDNLNSRLSFEKEAVSLLRKNGINAVQGIKMFPQNMSKEAQTPKNFIKIIQNNDIDGVITMSLINTEDSHRYTPGNNVSVPVGYYRVGKHLFRRYVTIREPGYYEPTKSYVIEAVLYNLKGILTENKNTWVWTGETSLVNPSSLKSGASNFSKKLVGQIIKDKIIDSK